MNSTTIVAALAFALLCDGCSQQAAVVATPSPQALNTATTSPAAHPDHTSADGSASPESQCKSWGILPGTPGYQQCIDGMTEAANAGGQQVPMDAKRMRESMEADMKAAAQNPKCTTVTQGTNTSVSCP